MNFQSYAISKTSEWACIQVKSPESENRVPVHLFCVLDTSCSMNYCAKLENVKKSLQFLLDFLGSRDIISVITFSTTAKTILSQECINEDSRSRISFINSESCTNLSAGIIEASKSLLKGTDYKQGILLLTDGLANRGIINSDDILAIVKNTIRDFNTSMSCIGYGTDHNVDLLQSMSVVGGGSYYVVNNLEDVAKVFGDVLGGLVSCVAQQVKVILPVGTEVKSRYATNRDGSNLEIIIGDMPAGMEAIFLARIPVTFTIQLQGYDIKNNTPFITYSIVVITDDTNLLLNGEAHYLRFEVMELLDETHKLLDGGNFTKQIEKIDTCIKKITDYKIEHSLWNMLLEELNNCKYILENKDIHFDTSQLMRQHAGYIGIMRGFRATSDSTYRHIDTNNTFSNSLQRNISRQMTENVNQVKEVKEVPTLKRQFADSSKSWLSYIGL